MDANRFPYGIGIEYDGRLISDNNLEVVTIPHTHTRCLPAAEKCPTHSRKPTTRLFPNFSRRAISMNTQRELSSMYIRQKTSQTPITPVKSGLRLKKSKDYPLPADELCGLLHLIDL